MLNYIKELINKIKDQTFIFAIVIILILIVLIPKDQNTSLYVIAVVTIYAITLTADTISKIKIRSSNENKKNIEFIKGKVKEIVGELEPLQANTTSIYEQTEKDRKIINKIHEILGALE